MAGKRQTLFTQLLEHPQPRSPILDAFSALRVLMSVAVLCAMSMMVMMMAVMVVLQAYLMVVDDFILVLHTGTGSAAELAVYF